MSIFRAFWGCFIIPAVGYMHCSVVCLIVMGLFENHSVRHSFSPIYGIGCRIYCTISHSSIRVCFTWMFNYYSFYIKIENVKVIRSQLICPKASIIALLARRMWAALTNWQVNIKIILINASIIIDTFGTRSIYKLKAFLFISNRISIKLEQWPIGCLSLPFHLF